MIAAVLSTVSAVPQVWRTWTTRSARDLSFVSMLIALVATVLWIIYGLMMQGWSVVLANGLVGFLVAALIVMKLIFDRNDA